MLDMASQMYSGKRIDDCSHVHEQRYLNELTLVAEHSHNKEHFGKVSQKAASVFNPLLTIDKTYKRSHVHNLHTADACATTGKENKKPFSVPGKCNEVTIVSKLKSQNEDTPKSELGRQPQKVVKSVKLTRSNTRKRQSKTKHQRLSRKAESRYQCVKDVHQAVNDLLSEVDVKTRQPERRNLGQIDSLKECTKTPFIYKYPTGSQNWMSGTLETVSTQLTDNASCRNPSQILESVPSLLKQPSVKIKSDMVYETGGSASNGVDYREVSSLNGSSEIRHPLRLTRKRKVQEIDYFNQTDESFHKTRSRKQLSSVESSTDFLSKEMDSKTEKLETEMQKANVQAKSQKVHEELFHKQKNSRTLQINSTANHKMKTTTQVKTDMRNVSNILNTSGISKSRMAKKSTIFKKDNPGFKRNIKSCVPDRSRNNLQTAQERFIGVQPSDSNRLLRAKAVKRALSFNTKRSPQITNNGKFTVINKKAGGTLGFPTPVWKTENGWTPDGKENDCFKLTNAQSSGSDNSIKNKFMHLSPPVDDLNSSDPYEFKVSPFKPQGKINVNQKQTKTPCQRRSKLGSQTSKKRNNKLVAAAKSVICCASSVSISDLVEQKSKHLFPGNSEVIPLATTIHDHQQKCEGENNEKCLQTNEVRINTDQCTIARKTGFPGTERDTMSKKTHMKTSPLQMSQPVEILPVSAREESKLSSSVNSFSCSSKDAPRMKVLSSKKNIGIIVDNKSSQIVASEARNAALGSLYFEKQLSGNKQFVENSKIDKLTVICSSFPHRKVDDYKSTNAASGSLYFEKWLSLNKQFKRNCKIDKLPVSCSSFPHRRVNDYKPTGHDVLTVDFQRNVKLVSGNCNDEESSSDEEVLLLD